MSPTVVIATISIKTSTATRFARSRKVTLIECRLKHRSRVPTTRNAVEETRSELKIVFALRNRLMPRRFRRKPVLDVQQPAVHNRNCELRHRMRFEQSLGQHSGHQLLGLVINWPQRKQVSEINLLTLFSQDHSAIARRVFLSPVMNK